MEGKHTPNQQVAPTHKLYIGNTFVETKSTVSVCIVFKYEILYDRICVSDWIRFDCMFGVVGVCRCRDNCV